MTIEQAINRSRMSQEVVFVESDGNLTEILEEVVDSFRFQPEYREFARKCFDLIPQIGCLRGHHFIGLDEDTWIICVIPAREAYRMAV